MTKILRAIPRDGRVRQPRRVTAAPNGVSGGGYLGRLILSAKSAP